MKDQWRVQQMAQQMVAAAMTMQQGGQSNFANFGNGGWQQQGRQQNERATGASEAKPCCRCGSNQHHQSQCAKRTDGSMYQTCNKPGQLAKMCRSKATTSSTTEALCKCCGKPGHEKKDCAWVDMECEACHKKGHTIWVCRKAQKVNTSTSSSPTTPTAASSPAAAKQQPAKTGVPTNAATPTAVAAGDAWWTYRCKECSMGIKDPDKIATV